MSNLENELSLWTFTCRRGERGPALGEIVRQVPMVTVDGDDYRLTAPVTMSAEVARDVVRYLQDAVSRAMPGDYTVEITIREKAT